MAYHEAEEHCRKRFYCPVCEQDLSSFEALRTHSNSQHYHSREFQCEICKTAYLDPARRAKCRKRHLGQYRCPVDGCKYYNARPNSVVRHAQSQHDLVVGGSNLIFDRKLGTRDPPKLRRGAAVRGVSQTPSLSTEQGPSDDELFKHSEDLRRQRMASLREEHVKWLGGEEKLHTAVPNYPEWQPRDHPYGRMASPSGVPSSNSTRGINAPGTSLSPSPLWSATDLDKVFTTLVQPTLPEQPPEDDIDLSLVFGTESSWELATPDPYIPLFASSTPVSMSAWPADNTYAGTSNPMPDMESTCYIQDPSSYLPGTSPYAPTLPFSPVIGFENYGSIDATTALDSTISAYGSGSFSSTWMKYDNSP